MVVKLLVLVAIVVVVIVIARSARAGSGASLSFTPVEELPEPVRARIEALLAEGRRTEAATTYREATGSGAAQARTALDTHDWKRGEAS